MFQVPDSLAAGKVSTESKGRGNDLCLTSDPIYDGGFNEGSSGQFIVPIHMRANTAVTVEFLCFQSGGICPVRANLYVIVTSIEVYEPTVTCN